MQKIEVEDLPVSRPTGTDANGKRRGAGSYRNRNKKFLENKNNQLNEDNRRRIKEQLDPEDLSELLKTAKIDGEFGAKKVLPIPCTTRGIGFHVADFMTFAVANVPNFIQLNFDVHSMYRVALMQLDRQIQNAACVRNFDSSVTVAPVVRRAYKMLERRTYRLLAECINMVGDFNHNGMNCVSFIPEMLKGYTKQSRVVNTVQQLSTVEEPTYNPLSPDPEPKRLATPSPSLISEVAHLVHEQSVEVDIPDPYHITIRNLEQVVRLLSNNNTPLEYRRFFILKNPIPGAVFQDDILVNPFEIMPQNYLNSERMWTDISEYSRLMNQVEEYDSRSIGAINMTGNGSSVSLGSQHNEVTDVFKLSSATADVPCYTKFRSHLGMDEQAFLRSMISLMGEFPYIPNVPDSVYIPWSIRRPHVANRTSVNLWRSLVSVMRPRHY